MVRSIDTDAVIDEVLDDDQAKNPEKQAKNAEKPFVAADDAIEGLKQQLAAEKSRREEAERRARAAQAEVYQAKTEVEENQRILIGNGIETVRQNVANLKAAYAHALANGDTQRAADIQFEMSNAAVKLQMMESGKQAFEERPRAAPPPPVADNPVENIASRLTPRSAAWVRSHPEYASGQKYFEMVSAHNLAVARGVPVDTDEYFATVERILDLEASPSSSRRAASEPDDDGTEAAAKVVSRRQSPAAAPVSRSSYGSASSNSRSFTLSKDEREMARMSGMTEREYWERQQEAKRRGEI